jgi:Periplasmic component of the Tol biopolymer transport system
MKTLIRVGVVLASAAALIACSDVNPTAVSQTEADTTKVVEPPNGMVISNSIKGVITGSSAGALDVAQSGSGDNGEAYVSAAPGTFPRGISGNLQNKTTAGSSRRIEFTDGGFDPVGIPASVGDELSLTWFLASGQPQSFSVRVPPRRPPEVVRTEPAKGRTDVALNIQVQVVFSEPVDKATVTSSSVVLFEGPNSENAVRATVSTSSDGLSVIVTPAAPLDPLSTYTVALTSAIHDLDGDAVANSTPLTFTTESRSTADTGGDLLFVGLVDRQLYRIGLDGKNYRKLTSSGNNDHAAWSPKGDLIAFGRGAFGSGDIYVMSESGSNVRRLTTNMNLRSAVWSPDGKTLAVSDEGTYFGSIWTISAVDDEPVPTQIAHDARTPAWSPDGRRIAFVRLSGDDGYHQIFLMDTDGSNVTPLIELDEGGIYGLSWSPDGRQLAFGKCIGPTGCQIYIINADGSQLHSITNENDAQNPTWSPDGKWIAFTTSVWGWASDWHPSLAYVSPDGGVVRKVIDEAFYPSFHP